MATITSSRSSLGHAIQARMDEWLAAWRTSRALREAYRTTVRELSALSSAELNDIGINKADIHSVAWEATYGEAVR